MVVAMIVDTTATMRLVTIGPVTSGRFQMSK